MLLWLRFAVVDIVVVVVVAIVAVVVAVLPLLGSYKTRAAKLKADDAG